jgi:hypothetical protein
VTRAQEIRALHPFGRVARRVHAARNAWDPTVRIVGNSVSGNFEVPDFPLKRGARRVHAARNPTVMSDRTPR